jgi:hypothetical protein
MAYQAHHGPGQHPGYQHGDAGPNEAYFDKPDDDSPFSHYKDNEYDKDNLAGDYHNKEEEEQNKEKENKKDTLMDAVKKEEEKAKKQESHKDVHKKVADEIRHEQMAMNKQPNAPKKKAKDHKSIEDAIKDASRKKEGVFVLK